MVIWVNKISILEYEERMTFLDRMTFFRQNDKRTYCYNRFWNIKIEALNFKGQWDKGNWYNALKAMFQVRCLKGQKLNGLLLVFQ